MANLRILGVAGSLRRASYNRGLIRAAMEVSPSGVVIDPFDLGAVPFYNQDVEGEARFVYYGETDSGRFLAVILTERDQYIRVIIAYDLDAGQKRDYLERRRQGE